MFRFVVFGLDLFNTAFRRSRFDFNDPTIVARLEPMVAVIGNTLYSNNAMVISAGMKAAASIIKAPLKSLDKSLPIFVRQIIDIVKQTGSTESDAVQTAFKSLATILRDSPTVHVKEKDLVYLLDLLTPDLEDPLRQASVFSMLRAIVSRKFVVHEIYDLMDKVSEIMVTNQSNQVQELCRSVLLQFLLDYPQGKGRLRNQMTFMAKNLSYVYESGRKSVMELLSAIMFKFEVGLVREYADLLFVGLVMVIANDDSAKCREMAAGLVKNLISRLDGDHRRIIMSHLHAWASQQSQPQLVRVSSQVYGLIIDTLGDDASPYVPNMLEDVNAALERSRREFDSITTSADEVESMKVDLEWQVPYHALIVISKILRVFPDLTAQLDKVDWNTIIEHLLFPHAWVRTVSCRLLGLLFTAVPIAAPRLDLPHPSPFSSLGMREVAQKLCLQLKSEHLDASLSLQVVKNLLYIGKCFCAVPVPAADEEEDEGADGMDGDDQDVPENQGLAQERNPLPWLFSKLSYQVRSAHIGRRNRSVSPVRNSHQHWIQRTDIP
jgi:U3 small nucleolar RNA-associated protein 20